MINLQAIFFLWIFMVLALMIAFGAYYGGEMSSKTSLSLLRWLGGFTVTQFFGYTIYLFRNYWNFKNIAAEVNLNIEQNDYGTLKNTINRYEEKRENHVKVAKLFDQHYAAVMEFITYYIDISKAINAGKWQEAQNILVESEKWLKIVRTKKGSPFCSELARIISCYEQNKIAILFYTSNQHQDKGIKNIKLETQTKEEIETLHSKRGSLIKALCIVERILDDREKIKKDYLSDDIYDIYNRMIYDTVVLCLYSHKDSTQVIIKNNEERVAIEAIINKYDLSASELLEELENQITLVDVAKIRARLFKNYFPNLDFKKNAEEICDLDPEYLNRIRTPNIIFGNNARSVMQGKNMKLQYFKELEVAVRQIREHLKYQYNICLYNIAAKIINLALFTDQQTCDYLYEVISKIHFDKVKETHMWFSHKKLKVTANLLTRYDTDGVYQFIRACNDYTVIYDCIENLMIVFAKTEALDEFEKLKVIREKLIADKGLLIEEADFKFFRQLNVNVTQIDLIYSAASVSYVEFFIDPWEKSLI